ncbi:MAG: hypothetical protein AAF762_09905 [Pseudomonadota bacterium]
MTPGDLGHGGDDPATLTARLDEGGDLTGAVLISGGAGARDEDHLARLLSEAGTATTGASR